MVVGEGTNSQAEACVLGLMVAEKWTVLELQEPGVQEVRGFGMEDQAPRMIERQLLHRWVQPSSTRSQIRRRTICLGTRLADGVF